MSAEVHTHDGAARRLARRHPVTAFLVGTLALTGTTMTLAVLVQERTLPGRTLPGFVGVETEEAASFLLVLSLFVVTVVVTGLEGGRPALVTLLRRMTRWRVGLVWWFLAAASLPLTTVLLAVVLGDSAGVPGASSLVREAGSLLVALALVNVFEESAWTGFMQTHLERHHNFFVAAVLTAVPFSLVHVPIRVISGEATTSAEIASSFVSLMIFTPVIRILFGAVVRGAGNSVLLAAVTHTMFNRSNNEDGLAADILTGTARQGAALLAVALVALVVVLAIGRRGVSRQRRRELDTLERPSAR